MDCVNIVLQSNGAASIEDNNVGIDVDALAARYKMQPEKVLLAIAFEVDAFERNAYYASTGPRPTRNLQIAVASSHSRFETWFSELKWMQEYKNGVATSNLFKEKSSHVEGNRIDFTPDDAIFPEPRFDVETIVAGVCPYNNR